MVVRRKSAQGRTKALSANRHKEVCMKLSEYATTRAACAYFFICPGLTYGIFTSRLPALKEQTGADEAQIGLFLLCLGSASLVALFSSGRLIARWGSSLILRTGSLALLVAVVLCGAATTPLSLGAACLLTGFGMGLADVSMNTQGIQIERRYSTSCMAFMHASYSFGGVTGALTGALFASLGLSPFVNTACVLGIYACFRPWASSKLLPDRPVKRDSGQKASPHAVPLFVVMCGIVSLLAYAAEGSVAEWGSLLLVTVKGADESTAACVFAAFSIPTVFCRLFGDRLRDRFGDFALTFSGGLISVCGMALVLLSANPVVCLAGYALMGAGLSPIVPILFSRAGSHPGVSPGKASTVVSLLSYSGLLFFPPLLGFVAQGYGLQKSLCIVFIVCILITLGTWLLRKKSVS